MSEFNIDHNPDWLGNQLKLIKASVLNGDKEQAEIVVQQLVNTYGESGTEKLYTSAVQLLREERKIPNAWWFGSLLGK